MFGWLKSKKTAIYAPVAGEVVDLSSVPDEVFSAKMAGEGMAIKPSEDIFRSPIDGVITKIFPTNHAFVASNDGLDVIVHIGIDTVELRGEGFTRLIKEGESVKAGDPVIQVDLPLISSKAKSIVTPIVVNNAKVSICQQHNVYSKDLIMEVN
ncbi:MAG: PTS glucose transporter subunit IIA [Campylobacterales bacterium]|nr:PTS glucose transporter subunit IIA [Campylobacterales bacterium]